MAWFLRYHLRDTIRREVEGKPMAAKTGTGSWKKERTTGRKYSGEDSDKTPAPGTREKIWISGYTRADGKKIEGYFRGNPAAPDGGHR